MPHKHIRKGKDKLTVDLPPTVIAKPLPVSKSAKVNEIFTTEINAVRKAVKRTRNVDKSDDTPRAFARLMSFREGKKLPKGLDDGVQPTKKQKREDAQNVAVSKGPVAITQAAQAQDIDVPKILPGERMSEFSARVDAALPISGLIKKTVRGGKDPLGLKVVRTKKEKKMHKMYEEWREQDRKLKEKKQEVLELAEAEDDDDSGGVKWKIDMEISQRRRKKKTKNTKALGDIDDCDGDDDDPWAVVKRARGEGPKSLHDVAQAPPHFSQVPKEKFKVRGARVNIENVPKSSGSLRRREELGEVRRSVVEGYRQMMKENKSAAREHL